MAKQSGGGSRVSVVLSVKDGHLSRIRQVAERLRGAGMHVESIMPAIGTVSGSVDASLVEKLKGVEGVGAVERSGEVRIAPPESDTQ